VGTIAHEPVTLLTDYDTTSPYAIAYQNLFANIRFDWDQEKIKQHTITLVTPTEHSSRATAAINVAITAAQNAIPTVLVDADLYTPSLHKRFGIQEPQGLRELLEEQRPTTQAISHILSKTFIPDLSLLGAGSTRLQPREMSHLLTTKLPKIIDGLRQYLEETNECRSGLIILHTPPMSSRIDASVISSMVDRTFLLLIIGQTKRTQALKAQQQLERARAKSVGVIILDA